MTIAAITVDAVLGSKDSALMGTTYVLSTSGGFAVTVTQVTWTLTDSPPDSVSVFLDSGSGIPVVIAPFTNRLIPDVPGTYLFDLEIIDAIDGTTTDTQGICVRHVPTKRIPAIGESNQFDFPSGWAKARNEDLSRADVNERQILPSGGVPIIVYNKSGVAILRNSLIVVQDPLLAENLNLTRLTDILGHVHVAGTIPQYLLQARSWDFASAPGSPAPGLVYTGIKLFALNEIPSLAAGYAFIEGFNYYDTSAWAAVGDPVYVQDDGSIGPVAGTVPAVAGTVYIQGTSASDNPGYVYLDARFI